MIFFDLFSFFNNLLAKVQLSITPQQRSGKISHFLQPKTERRARTFCWPTLSHSTLGNSKAASRRRRAGLESQWIRRLFYHNYRQQMCEGFRYWRTCEGKICSECERAARKLAPETSDLLGYSSKAVAPPQGTAWETEIREPPVNNSSCMKIGQNALTSLIHGVTAITGTVPLY